MRNNLPLVYIDETVFTKKTYHERDYWVKNEKVEVDADEVYIPYVCAIAAVSAQNGLEHLRTYNTAVKGEDFAQFIEELSAKLKGKPFALFMDQASFHKSDPVKEAIAIGKVTRIWNVAYCPWFNPIEGCFAIIKNHYKRSRLNAMRNSKIRVV